MDRKEILRKVDHLLTMYKNGELGGEVMPEDANPHLGSSSLKNYLYFTLPMALNYQRNSYTLWESALKTFHDNETNFVFDPKTCLEKSSNEVQSALTKYKLALQKQKQTEIWLALCGTFVELFNGDIRELFNSLDNDVNKNQDDDEINSGNVQQIVIGRWQELLENTEYQPIDVHIPLWLWSRNGFREIEAG